MYIYVYIYIHIYIYIFICILPTFCSLLRLSNCQLLHWRFCIAIIHRHNLVALCLQNIPRIVRLVSASLCFVLAHTNLLYSAALTYHPLDKMAAISQTIFSNAFSWIKRVLFWLIFHCNLFIRVQLTITPHWFVSGSMSESHDVFLELICCVCSRCQTGAWLCDCINDDLSGEVLSATRRGMQPNCVKCILSFICFVCGMSERMNEWMVWWMNTMINESMVWWMNEMCLSSSGVVVGAQARLTG